MGLASGGFLGLTDRCLGKRPPLEQPLAGLRSAAKVADHPCLGQGILFSTLEILRTPLDLVRLWLHEAERVYGDKMVDEKDQETLRRVTIASTKKFFDVSQATKSL